MSHPEYKQCPFCAEDIRFQASKCRYCGELLDAPSPLAEPQSITRSPAESLELAEETFRSLGIEISRKHKQRLQAFVSAGEEQYRMASILFVDISGYTKLCERLSTETIKEMLDEYYAICTQTVDFYNGFVLEFEGDGCLAVFGAPIAYDRDAESALRAAIEIRARVESLAPIHGHKLRMSAAVESGQILSSFIRTRIPAQFKVFGAAVNLAARIQSSGKPGWILAGPQAHELSRNAFEFKKNRARRFKNVQLPVITYRVIATRTEDVSSRDMSFKFVGRKSELLHLQAVWSQFRASCERGGTVSILPAFIVAGEPGIGKTRIAAHFGELVASEARTIRSESAPYEAKIPLGLWRTVLTQVGGGDCNATSMLLQIKSVLEALGFSSTEHRTFLAILGHQDAVRELSSISHQNLRRQVCADLRDFLQRLAITRPVLLILDDLQWCDHTSIAILDQLIATPPRNVFFLLLMRDGILLQGEHLNQLQHVRLRGLDLQSRQMLFKQLAKIPDLSGEDGETLAEKAGGNPFHMMELLRNFQELRQAARSKGSKARVDVQELVPLSLKQVLQSRIDFLDQRQRLVLQCGAVLGRRFALETIQLFNLIREGLLGRLFSLRTIELLQDHLTPEGLEFSFHHHVTREVAYQSLLQRQRRELHGAIARQLETRFGELASDNAPLLAYHFAEADENVPAAKYMQIAGERAAALGAVDDALDYFNDALTRLGSSRLASEHRAQSVTLHRHLGRALRISGRSIEAIESLKRAHGMAQRARFSGELLLVKRELAIGLLQTSNYDAAEKYLRAAIISARKSKLKLLNGQCTNVLGLCHWGRGNLRQARKSYQAVFALQVDEEDFALAADLRNNLALVEWKSGNLSAAATMFRQALKFRHRAGDKFGVAATLMNLGIVEENMGQTRQAERHYAEAVTLAERIQYRQVVTACHANLANLFLTQQAFDEALKHSAISLECARAIGDRRSSAIALENLSLAHLGLNQFDDTRRLLLDGRKIAGAIDDTERILSLDLVDIELRLSLGDLTAAEKLLQSAAQQLQKLGLKSEEPRLLRLQGQAALAAHKTAEAAELFAAAVAEARRQGNIVELHRSETRLMT